MCFNKLTGWRGTEEASLCSESDTSFVFQKGRFHKFPKPPTAINKEVDYFLSGKSVSLCVGVCLSVCECVGVCEYV